MLVLVSLSWCVDKVSSSLIYCLIQTQMSNLVLLIEEGLQAVQILDLGPKHENKNELQCMADVQKRSV